MSCSVLFFLLHKQTAEGRDFKTFYRFTEENFCWFTSTYFLGENNETRCKALSTNQRNKNFALLYDRSWLQSEIREKIRSCSQTNIDQKNVKLNKKLRRKKTGKPIKFDKKKNCRKNEKSKK